MPADKRTLSRRYLEHTLAGRGTEAVQSVLEPLISGELELVELYEEILAPAAEQIGELWHRSEISVADEHFATQLNQQVIATAIALLPRKPPGERTVVLACPPDELHDVGLRMLAHLLGANGYNTHLLGASTPVPALVSYVRRVGADAVGLSVTSPLSIPGLAQAVDGLRQLEPPPRIFVGGRCAQLYPAVPAAVGASATPGSIIETLEYLAS